MEQQTTQCRHPLQRLRTSLEAALDEAADAAVWTLAPQELVELLPGLTRLRSRLAAVELAVAAQADRTRVGDPVGAASTAAW